jgi:TorA maturation chaperone TorD
VDVDEYSAKALIASQRSLVYLLLSQLFLRSPRTGFLRELIESLGKLDIRIQDVPPELVKIKRILEGHNDIDSLSLELRKDYTRLFLGVKPGYSPPPPYESVYRGEKRLYGESTLKVLKFYIKWGFDPIRVLEYKGPPDHFGVEAAFMAYLCSLEEDAWKNRNLKRAKEVIDGEVKFFNNHLYVWAPKMLKTMEGRAQTEFYKAITSLARRFLEEEKNYLETATSTSDEG